MEFRRRGLIAWGGMAAIACNRCSGWLNAALGLLLFAGFLPLFWWLGLKLDRFRGGKPAPIAGWLVLALGAFFAAGSTIDHTGVLLDAHFGVCALVFLSLAAGSYRLGGSATRRQ